MNKDLFEILSILSIELKTPYWKLLERKWSELITQLKMVEYYYKKINKSN